MTAGDDNPSSRDAGVLFATLVASYDGRPGITYGASDPSRTGFGSHALKVGGKIFAMHVRGQLVVKLPRDRVDALVDAGEATRFDANKDRPFREWAALRVDSTADWHALAAEALAFVGPRG